MRPFKRLSHCAILAVLVFPLESTAQPAPGTQDTLPAITVTDARPKPETTEWLGLASTDCNTGIRRLGEEKTSPPRLTILQRDLRDALGDKYPGAKLVVTKYSIFFNMSYWLQATNPGARSLFSGLVAHDCMKENTIDGWYSPDEATTQNAPVIVEIEASWNDKPLSTRLVYSTPEDITGSWGLFGNKAKGEAALLEAMKQAHAILIEQIKTR